MPTLIAGPVAAVNDLADQLARQVQSGATGRATLGSKDQAFAWTTGAPPIIATKVNRVVVDGMSFNAVLVGLSANPPALVAEGGTKPVSIALTSKSVALKKFAGIGEFSTEDFLGTDSLAAAVYATLITGALTAYDTTVVDEIESSAALTATGTTWAATILNGIAAVARRDESRRRDGSPGANLSKINGAG